MTMVHQYEFRGAPDTIVRMSGLLSEAFPGIFDPDQPILGATDEVLIAPNFQELLEDERTLCTMLTDTSGNITALDVATPLDVMDPGRNEPQTAYLYFTAVSKAHQGQGLVWKLHEEAFRKLRDAGYSAVELDAVLNGSYVNNLKKVYGDAATESGAAHNSWGAGMEQPLRIDLEKYFSRLERESQS